MELSIAIPFYNEEKNVLLVLDSVSRELERSKIDYEVIAIDNGSQDRTSEIIDTLARKNKRIKKLTIKKNIGYGYGINQGLKACRGKYVGYMWGDNQISPKTIMTIYHELIKKNLDLCKIARVKRTESFIRKIESFGYNRMMKLLFGIDTRDANGCPKIMKKEVFESLDIKSKDWFIDAEIMIKCRRKGYKIREIPVVSTKRKTGKSKVNFATVFEFAGNIAKYVFGGKFG